MEEIQGEVVEELLLQQPESPAAAADEEAPMGNNNDISTPADVAVARIQEDADVMERVAGSGEASEQVDVVAAQLPDSSALVVAEQSPLSAARQSPPEDMAATVTTNEVVNCTVEALLVFDSQQPRDLRGGDLCEGLNGSADHPNSLQSPNMDDDNSVLRSEPEAVHTNHDAQSDCQLDQDANPLQINHNGAGGPYVSVPPMEASDVAVPSVGTTVPISGSVEATTSGPSVCPSETLIASSSDKASSSSKVPHRPTDEFLASCAENDSLAKVESLEAELAKARDLIETLQQQQNEAAKGDDMMIAMQSNLQQQMSFKAEAENKLRLAENRIRELEQTAELQAEEISKFGSLQENLEQQMTAKAEAENKARSAYDRVQQLESDKEQNVDDLKMLHKQLVEAREALVAQEIELEKVRHDRNDQERKTMALTSRLNAAKKKEAVKVNLVEEFEDDLKAALEELEKTKKELKQALADKTALAQKLEYTEKSSQERIDHLEVVLAEEKRLNQERKTKMKEFVENKAEELRQAKEDNDSLQVELTQTNRSLVDLNNRWKQLHTQWVQAQTRNRELQRDLNRTKKDSENLHKQGDSLEMKLSRSANETEEHKNKRLAAKHELMSVLRTLDAERDVTAKLRDKIKFTFTPKAQSQRQVLNESLDEFEASLQKLSLRLGKPIPPLHAVEPNDDESAAGNSGGFNFTANNGDGNHAHADIGPLVEKLELESNRVTQAISTVANSVERLQALLHAGGDRTCFTVLSELVTTGTMASSPAIQGERAAITGALPTIGRSHRYGQVPGVSSDHS